MPMANAISITVGRILICFERLNIIGVAISASVSFIRNAAIALIPAIISAKALPGVLAISIILSVEYSRSPERSMAATIVNIPIRKKITFRLTD